MFIMHYKKWLVIVFASITLPAIAMNWPDYLRFEMLHAYDDLMEKTTICRSERNVVAMGDITSSWFNDLPSKQRNSVILLLSQINMDQCVNEEEANYTKALLNYVAETGESKRLDDWLVLKKVFVHRELRADFNQLDLRQIQLLSEEPPFNKPFDPLQVSELYRSE